jgi:hypothetical protein
MEIFFKVILKPFANFEAIRKRNDLKDQNIFFYGLESEYKQYSPFPGFEPSSC